MLEIKCSFCLSKKHLTKFFNIFAASVTSLYNAWLVGDNFLRAQFPALQLMKTNDEIKMPYIYDYFNILPQYQPSNGMADGALE